MTTEAAARLYEAKHLNAMHGKGWAIVNPHNKPLAELPVIYGFNNGGRPGWYFAQLLAEDGTAMGSHICSSESYMQHDLGILEGTRSDRHEHFKEHYPDGYRMEFVSSSEIKAHANLAEAFRLNQEKHKAAEAEKAPAV